MRILGMNAILAVIMTAWMLSGCMAQKNQPVADLESQLVDREWVAEYILDQPVIDSSHSSIVFTEDGAVSGMGGCNRFNGQYTLTDGKVALGPLATTMMACVPPLDDQEIRFFQSLSEPLAVKFENGLLYLVAADGRKSVFAIQN